MKREDFTLFFSMPPDETDWKNLQVSGVKRVMVPWNMLTKAEYDRFRNTGVKVVLRMSDEQATKLYAITGEAQQAWAKGQGIIDAVILGCEPEAGHNWTWGADWQMGKAWDHQAQVSRLRDTVRANMPGVPVVSPGWSQGGYTEVDLPEPGLISWREVTTPVYNACDGNAVHIYQHTYSSQLDEVRLLLQVRKWSELRHRLIWIDEVGINEGDEAHRVDCYLKLARMLTLAPGQRVTMLCPFVSNGIPNGWDGRYLIRSTDSYAKIAAFMRGDW